MPSGIFNVLGKAFPYQDAEISAVLCCVFCYWFSHLLSPQCRHVSQRIRQVRIHFRDLGFIARIGSLQQLSQAERLMDPSLIEDRHSLSEEGLPAYSACRFATGEVCCRRKKK
jgi:hypothetical protein